MLAVVVVEAVAIVLLAVLVVGLLRSHADILRALHDLGATTDPDAAAEAAARGTSASGRPLLPLTARSGGEAAYDVSGADLSGDGVAVAVRGVAHDTLLAFLSSGCLTCQPFWASLRSGVDVPGGARLVVVVQDEDSRAHLRRLAGDDLLVVASTAAWESYGVPGSPHFVYVDGPSSRVVGEGTAPDWERVRDLLERGRDLAVDVGHGDRDDPGRIDAELAAAGIAAGHPSLYDAPEPGLDG